MSRRPIVSPPEAIRQPRGTLPDLDSPLDLEFELTRQETECIRIGMAIHSASRKPALTWAGWKHIAVALSIGAEQALRAADGRNDTPDYRRVMTDFLRRTGFTFLNKDDRAAAVRLLPLWEEIDAWRSTLPHGQQRRLNNPREVAREFEERDNAQTSRGKPMPSTRHHRKLPTPTEQFLAMAMEVELANERAERAEREAEYFSGMMDAIALRARLSDDTIAEIRTRVRAEQQAMMDDTNDE
jgi:hypothetical protein